MPEFREIGLDPAVQGVPVKKKRSVHHFISDLLVNTICTHLLSAATKTS